MRNREQSSIIARAKRSKSQIHRDAARSLRITRIATGMARGHAMYSPGLTGWWQLRKRAQQRLRNLSGGALTFHENGYRGDHVQHWVKNAICGHVFKISLKCVSIISASKCCPFCHGARDMSRYGSVEAVQEHVYNLSGGNVYFLPDNILSSSSDNYRFHCLIQKFLYETSFDSFLEEARTTNGYPICYNE